MATSDDRIADQLRALRQQDEQALAQAAAARPPRRSQTLSEALAERMRTAEETVAWHDIQPHIALAGRFYDWTRRYGISSRLMWVTVPRRYIGSRRIQVPQGWTLWASAISVLVVESELVKYGVVWESDPDIREENVENRYYYPVRLHVAGDGTLLTVDPRQLSCKNQPESATKRSYDHLDWTELTAATAHFLGWIPPIEEMEAEIAKIAHREGKPWFGMD